MYEFNTRRKCDFHCLSCNTSLFKRSVMNTGIKLYKMSMRMKQLESFKDFNQKLKLLLYHAFYLLNEFFYI
jgi:hypothetical protein